MTSTPPTLHMLCGKIAAGKSTLAAKLGNAPATVVIAEDDWLKTLFADDMTTASDFVNCSAKLRTIMAPHVTSLLGAGVSVVLDFQANTVESRAWMRGIFDAADASHKLHYLSPSDDVCLARLQKRNASGDHPFAATEAQFHQFSRYFVAPTPEEGFNIFRYDDQL